MRTFRILRRLIGIALLALILAPTIFGTSAAEAGRITHSFIH